MWVEVTDAAMAVQELTDATAPAPDAVVAAASHVVPTAVAQ